MMDDQPPEEVEFIPWAELLARHRETRPLAVYLAAGALAAAGLGAVVARAVWRPELPPPTTMVEAAAEPAPSSTVPTYSEAQLMASRPPSLETLETLARAEWFVTDYFTVDGEPGAAAEVRAALPAGASLPPLPHDRAGPPTYVEWARSIGVEEVGAGVYRVTVAFRLVAGAEDGSFRRLPVRAVAVPVGTAPGGGTIVLDLPSPLPPPVTAEAVPWPEGEPATSEVAALAVEETAGWGSEPRAVDSGPAGDGWRVVVEAGDGSGRRWPLALWVDEVGPLAVPPWMGPASP